MIDMNEIQRRARAARETASANMREAVKKGEALAGRLREKPEEKPATEEAQTATNARRQVEILGQTFSGEDTAQMKASQARMAQIIQEQTAQAASMGAEAVMSQLFGEDMGVIAAALETLAMEESDEEEGTLSREEAEGILWDLSRQAAEELNSWREFAQSYLFGGLMWKMLCGASYLGYIADAAAALLAGKDGRAGQWRDFPWPARRKIGFAY